MLDGTNDPTALGWKQATADELLHYIAGASVDDQKRRAYEGELIVRQITAAEAAAAESAATGRKLVWLTVVLVILTGVLIWLTTRL